MSMWWWPYKAHLDVQAPTSTDPMKELCEARLIIDDLAEDVVLWRNQSGVFEGRIEKLCEAVEEVLNTREEFMKAVGVIANLRAHDVHKKALARLRTALENAKGGGR